MASQPAPYAKPVGSSLERLPLATIMILADVQLRSLPQIQPSPNDLWSIFENVSHFMPDSDSEITW